MLKALPLLGALLLSSSAAIPVAEPPPEPEPLLSEDTDVVELIKVIPPMPDGRLVSTVMVLLSSDVDPTTAENSLTTASTRLSTLLVTAPIQKNQVNNLVQPGADVAP